MLENGGNSEDGILANVGVAVLEASASGSKEGLDELGLAQFTKETKSVATDVFIGVLEVHADAVTMSYVSPIPLSSPSSLQNRFRCIPYEDHLLLQLSRRVQLRTDLIVQV